MMILCDANKVLHIKKNIVSRGNTNRFICLQNIVMNASKYLLNVVCILITLITHSNGFNAQLLCSSDNTASNFSSIRNK